MRIETVYVQTNHVQTVHVETIHELSLHGRSALLEPEPPQPQYPLLNIFIQKN